MSSSPANYQTPPEHLIQPWDSDIGSDSFTQEAPETIRETNATIPTLQNNRQFQQDKEGFVTIDISDDGSDDGSDHGSDDGSDHGSDDGSDDGSDHGSGSNMIPKHDSARRSGASPRYAINNDSDDDDLIERQSSYQDSIHSRSPFSDHFESDLESGSEADLQTRITSWVSSVSGKSTDDPEGSAARGLAAILRAGLLPCDDCEHRRRSDKKHCRIDSAQKCNTISHQGLASLATRTEDAIGLRNLYKGPPEFTDDNFEYVKRKFDSYSHANQIHVGMRVKDDSNTQRHEPRVCLQKNHQDLSEPYKVDFLYCSDNGMANFSSIDDLFKSFGREIDRTKPITFTACLKAGTTQPQGRNAALARKCCLENTMALLLPWIDGRLSSKLESGFRPFAHLDDCALWALNFSGSDSPSTNGVVRFSSSAGFHSAIRTAKIQKVLDLENLELGAGDHDEATRRNKEWIENTLSDDSQHIWAWQSSLTCTYEFLENLAKAEKDFLREGLLGDWQRCNQAFYHVPRKEYRQFLLDVIDRYYVGLDYLRAARTYSSSSSRHNTQARAYQALSLSLWDFLDPYSKYHDCVSNGHDDAKLPGLGFLKTIQSRGFCFFDQIHWGARQDAMPLLTSTAKIRLPLDPAAGNSSYIPFDLEEWDDYVTQRIKALTSPEPGSAMPSNLKRRLSYLTDQVILYLLQRWRILVGEVLLVDCTESHSNPTPRMKIERRHKVADDAIPFHRGFQSTIKDLGYPDGSFQLSQRHGKAAGQTFGKNEWGEWGLKSLFKFWFAGTIPSHWNSQSTDTNGHLYKKSEKHMQFTMTFNKYAALFEDFSELRSEDSFENKLYRSFWEHHCVVPYPDINHKRINYKDQKAVKLLSIDSRSYKLRTRWEEVPVLPEPARPLPYTIIEQEDQRLASLAGNRGQPAKGNSNQTRQPKRARLQ